MRTALGEDSFVFDGVSVELQRLVGRHWRTVATGRVADDGSYRVRVTPSRRSTVTYRVRYPGTRDDYRPVLSSVSRSFRIRAT